MDEDPLRLAAQAVEPLQQMDVPPALQESIARHQSHLASLAASLLAAGCEKDMVVTSVETAFASYKEELIAAILALKEANHDR
ncbi:MAG: hypothetical protein NXI21_18875 [Alphaproteobacteria bacterium]|nr:hypothetical protein [Alphaproteobacteria bacterium]